MGGIQSLRQAATGKAISYIMGFRFQDITGAAAAVAHPKFQTARTRYPIRPAQLWL